jgi:hypothetical protein
VELGHSPRQIQFLINEGFPLRGERYHTKCSQNSGTRLPACMKCKARKLHLAAMKVTEGSVTICGVGKGIYQEDQAGDGSDSRKHNCQRRPASARQSTRQTSNCRANHGGDQRPMAPTTILSGDSSVIPVPRVVSVTIQRERVVSLSGTPAWKRPRDRTCGTYVLDPKKEPFTPDRFIDFHMKAFQKSP